MYVNGCFFIIPYLCMHTCEFKGEQRRGIIHSSSSFSLFTLSDTLDWQDSVPVTGHYLIYTHRPDSPWSHLASP